MMRQTAVTTAEWRWVLVASVMLVIVLSVPYVLGWANSTDELQFSGFLFGIEDMNSYLAKMRYGARDGWEFQLVYTSESHQGGVAFVPFLALGKVVALITGEGGHVSAQALMIAYHVVRVPANLLLLIVTYRFIAEFQSDVDVRQLAWVLASALGGLGWIGLFFRSNAVVTDGLPVEWYIPEAFSTLIVYGLPHLAIARSGLLLGWLWFLSSVDAFDKRRILMAGGAWLVMGLCVPFFLALLGILMSAWLIGVAVLSKHFPTRELGVAALATSVPVVYLIYNLWLFTTNPVFAIWSSQNILPSPPLIDFVLAYGMHLVFAVVGFLGIRSTSGLGRGEILLIVWVVVAALLVYSPINVQRRLLEGAIVPLSVLAAVGFTRISQSLRPAAGWVLRAALLTTLMPGTLLLIAAGVATVSNPSWPVFHPADELAALRWLDMNTPADSVVLSTRQSGMVLPGFSHVRTFVGHGPETVRAVEKEENVRLLFATPGLADSVVGEYGVDYIWISPSERSLPCLSDLCSVTDTPPGYKLVFHQGDYTILEVER